MKIILKKSFQILNKKSHKIPLKEKKKQTLKKDNKSINKKVKNEKVEIKLLNKNHEKCPLIWIFLDKINTNISMGSISEMMCKHSIY